MLVVQQWLLQGCCWLAGSQHVWGCSWLAHWPMLELMAQPCTYHEPNKMHGNMRINGTCRSMQRPSCRLWLKQCLRRDLRRLADITAAEQASACNIARVQLCSRAIVTSYVAARSSTWSVTHDGR